MKTRMFTPNQVKADLIFLSSIIAVFGFKLTEAQTISLLGASALIAVGLNFAEAHVHVGVKISSTIDRALGEIKGILPAVQTLLQALPGSVAKEIEQALEKIEHGPGSTQTSGGGVTGKTS